MLDDPLLDYLKLKQGNKKRKRTVCNNNNDTFMEHIYKKGHDFEKEIINSIKTKYSDKFIQIGESYDANNFEKYMNTIKAIKADIKIIYQPVLWNHKTKTYGCGDLLICSDFANNIFPNYINNCSNNIYEVYDIKWSTIRLRTDSDEIINENNAKAFKSQVYIYTDALNEIQDHKATKAYIIGKVYSREKIINKITINENFSTYEKLGIINFKNEDEIINKTKDAIKWLSELKTNKKLRIDPPNDVRLYPNMKNSYDNEYSNIKKNLAIKNKELTLIYYVGKKNRDIAIKNNIKSYDDPRLSTEILGFKNKTKNTILIESIIDINRNNNTKLISYKRLDNYGLWKTSTIKCYVDIETINSSVYNIKHNKLNYIFMIGLGIVINDIWTFKIYTVKELTIDEESRILHNFSNELNALVAIGENISVFHWSNYENIFLKPYLLLNDNIKFYDMCKWFQDNEICIKGCLDFKLKNVVNSLYKLNLIDIQWSDSITNGCNAMNLAYNYYINKNNTCILNDIENYNEIDCKSMWKIHKTLENFNTDLP
jgi:hypothetical protein